jgi:hypothetical protein
MESILFFILTVYSFASGEGDKKKISNHLYSFSVPAHWEPATGMTGDGTIPGERNMGPYHLYYLQWNTPIKRIEDIPGTVGVFIESYQRIDKLPISLGEIEALELLKLDKASKFLSKEVIYEDTIQKRFMILTNSKEMDGRMVKYRVNYLLHRNGDIVHCMTISSSEKQYLFPGTSVIAKDILDSFSPQKEDHK